MLFTSCDVILHKWKGEFTVLSVKYYKHIKKDWKKTVIVLDSRRFAVICFMQDIASIRIYTLADGHINFFAIPRSQSRWRIILEDLKKDVSKENGESFVDETFSFFSGSLT